MIITKLGHCCFLIEHKGKRILTDPGNYSTAQNELEGLDLILITHEHQDHLHLESLKAVLNNNPRAEIVTNAAVGELLKKEKIKCQIIENQEVAKVLDLKLEAWEVPHTIIYGDLPRVPNTAFMLEDRLLFPGDVFFNPKKPVEILALPVAGPWMKISEAIDYALSIKPQKVFPIHDGILKQVSLAHWLPSELLPKQGIEFIPLKEGESHEFPDPITV